jgi:hypothetical protein
MALERELDQDVSQLDRIQPRVTLSSEYACAVLGEGRWSCPESCPNLLPGIHRAYADIAWECEIVQKQLGDMHYELIDVGVTIHQPYQPEFKTLQSLGNDGKINK